MFVNIFALHLVIFVMPFDIHTGMVYLYTTSVSLEDVCYTLLCSVIGHKLMHVFVNYEHYLYVEQAPTCSRLCFILRSFKSRLKDFFVLVSSVVDTCSSSKCL